jgi:hypothetical protein
MRLALVAAAAAISLAGCANIGASREYSANPTCTHIYGEDLHHCMGEMFAVMDAQSQAAEQRALAVQAERSAALAKAKAERDAEEAKNPALKAQRKAWEAAAKDQEFNQALINADVAEEELRLKAAEDAGGSDTVDRILLCGGEPDATTAWLCSKGD